jgi:hypothetical protein
MASAIEDIAEKVGEAVQHITKDDLVIVHCFDNVAFMSRSEEGGISRSASTTTSIMWKVIWL